MVFLDLEDYLYSFISENQVCYAPFLVDERSFPEVELTLVEGTVRNGDHFRRAREIREKSEHVVAMGTCAVYGGVQGQANRFPRAELMRRRFGKEASFEDEPQAVRRILPLDSYIAVDAYLPGCPPPVELLRSFLELALSGNLPTREASTVCSQCRVSSPPLPQPGPRRVTEQAPLAGKCLLEQGYLCMGPLTRDGCGAECPSRFGIPCTGCRGPSQAVLVSPSSDPKGETVRRLSRSTGKRPGEVESKIADPPHSFFMHCLAEPTLRRRRPEGTSPFIFREGER
jgi:F420-non-reducing hydrogenase small subunit